MHAAASPALVFGTIYVSVGSSLAVHTRIHGAALRHAAALPQASESHIPAAQLLFHFCDPVYDRSSWCFGGGAAAVVDAIAATAAAALREAAVDWPVRASPWQHPRTGYIDHVVLHDLHSDERHAAAAAVAAAARMAALGVTVYTYGCGRPRVPRASAAPSPPLQDDLLWLRQQLAFFSPSHSPPAFLPCFGEEGASHGACMCGAAPPILNYNVALRAEAVTMHQAREIARACSERAGGLPRVQSMALLRSLPAHAQLSPCDCGAVAGACACLPLHPATHVDACVRESHIEIACNLLDVDVSPPARVLETVQSKLASMGLPNDAIAREYTIGVTRAAAASRVMERVAR